MVKIIYTFVLMFAVMACTVKAGNKSSNVPQNNDVGPFVINFGGGDSYENSFEKDIHQSEGKVEYFTTPADHGKAKVDELTVTPSGCNESLTKAHLFWSEDASDAVVPLPVNSEFVILEKKGLVLLVVQGLEGCTKIKVKLKLSKVKVTPPPPPGSDFPEDLLGDWNKRTENFGYVFELKMNLAKNTENKVKMTYFTNCGNGTESFKGTVAVFEGTTDPKRFSVLIDEVTGEFFGGCGNVLALKASDKGKYVNCLAEKNAAWGTFELACSLETSPSVYPSNWQGADIHWR
ncbi:MAG: hypothetical protein AB7H97_00120 [Pseudobdellovibrionaceae bacterium]